MNANPISGPMTTSMTHHARDATSSRHSLHSNHRKAALCKRKKHLFQIPPRWPGPARARERGQILHGALAANPPSTEEHETVADTGRVGDLMDRQEQGSPPRRVGAKRCGNLAALSKIQSI